MDKQVFENDKREENPPEYHSTQRRCTIPHLRVSNTGIIGVDGDIEVNIVFSHYCISWRP